MTVIYWNPGDVFVWRGMFASASKLYETHMKKTSGQPRLTPHEFAMSLYHDKSLKRSNWREVAKSWRNSKQSFDVWRKNHMIGDRWDIPAKQQFLFQGA